MSDAYTDQLKKENEVLKMKMEQNENQTDAFLSQIDAHRGMLNEYINSLIMIRTQFIMLQKQHKIMNDKCAHQKDIIDGLNKQLAAASVTPDSIKPEKK